MLVSSMMSRTVVISFDNHPNKYPIWVSLFGYPLFSIGVDWKHWVLIGVPKWVTYLGTPKSSFIKIIFKAEKDGQ